MTSKVKMAWVIILVESWLGIVTSAIIIILALLGGSALKTASDSMAGGLAFGLSFGVLGFISLAVSVFGLLVARGIKAKAGWAKIAGIILGILNLPGFPLGTILGVLVLVGLINDDASSWFNTSVATKQ